VGCSSDHGFPDERFAATESWIINGQIDTNHDAVVAVFAQQSGCTATLIHKDGNNAFGLTAAHCFGFGNLQVAVIGDDYNNPDAVLDIFDHQIHPQYVPQENSYDFAVFKTCGAGASTPIIPALRPEEDTLQVGSQIDHVGYGLLSYPNGSTSVRHHAIGQVDQLAITRERVAGVISYGDQGCENYGVSGRVTSVYTNFIAPYIGNPQPTTVSSTTASGATTGVGSGGAGSGPTSGAGATDGDWVAGNLADRDIDGNLQSGCSTSGHRAPGSLAWLWALALLGLVRRRR
jgi:uncharacterized protein (TIGR03382 family)